MITVRDHFIVICKSWVLWNQNAPDVSWSRQMRSSQGNYQPLLLFSFLFGMELWILQIWVSFIPLPMTFDHDLLLEHRPVLDLGSETASIASWDQQPDCPWQKGHFIAGAVMDPDLQIFYRFWSMLSWHRWSLHFNKKARDKKITRVNE